MTIAADPPAGAAFSRGALVALRRKYARMVEMRRLNDSGTEHDARALMRELAAEFPGALREIDVLPFDILEERVRALDAAIAGEDDVTPWMRCVADYHATLRAVLRIKRMTLPRQDLAAALQIVARDYVPGEGEPLLSDFDAATLDAVLNPPEGRLNPWLYGVLERRHGIAAGELDALLFPKPQKLR